jgi:diguanylate cyclase (GGDEF)-like protein
MKQFEQTLLNQLQINDWNIRKRKAFFELTDHDENTLCQFFPIIQDYINTITEEFYQIQTQFDEITVLINDADTLFRLKESMKKNILSMFSGQYDSTFINSRLRIGIVHKRIGVTPHLYLAGINILKNLLHQLIQETLEESKARETINALDKLIFFDISYVFDTYISALVNESETAKDKLAIYANELEKTVQERTAELELLSLTDPLSGLSNIRHFKSELKMALKRCIRNTVPLTLIFFDVDNFKTINDTHGHEQGDKTIQIISECIRNTMRETDFAARYGGDEFCVILPDCDQPNSKKFNERLLEKVSEQANVTLSIGQITTGPNYYCTENELLNLADELMYQSKKQNKNKISAKTLNANMAHSQTAFSNTNKLSSFKAIKNELDNHHGKAG